LRRHIESLEASTKACYEAAPKKDGKTRRFKEFYDGAQSWSRVERVIARVEVGADGPDTRFIVTNLKKRNVRALYEDVYCRRGQAENHSSLGKPPGGRPHLMHQGNRQPVAAMWRVAQFDTLRLRLIKIAARVVEMKTMIQVHLPTSCRGQEIVRFAVGRIPRLVT
jgi:Transposase DDE domain group 1